MTREEAINILHGIRADNLNLDDAYTKDKYDALDMAIKALEQEPKAGNWIDTGSESFEFYRVYKCSECGNTEIEYPERICGYFRYCPNCGAKMESEGKG